MKYIISEYGLFIIAVIGFMGVIGVNTIIRTSYFDFSEKFIGSITGNYVSYNSDITLEDIEKGNY